MRRGEPTLGRNWDLWRIRGPSLGEDFASTKQSPATERNKTSVTRGWVLRVAGSFTATNIRRAAADRWAMAAVLEFHSGSNEVVEKLLKIR